MGSRGLAGWATVADGWGWVRHKQRVRKGRVGFEEGEGKGFHLEKKPLVLYYVIWDKLRITPPNFNIFSQVPHCTCKTRKGTSTCDFTQFGT